ncbi:MAG: electron transfer flavoprotein subunit alpha/FixB family protein [Kineosporiaceae bacterium]|nr:electron transfer flavoprotein subunit alpha/FixB family protein [Kineosporiaceae bacterium]
MSTSATTVLVLVEAEPEEMSTLSLEALTFARALAEPAGATVHALVVGDLPANGAGELSSHGAQVVHQVSDPRLAAYSAAAWASCVVDAIGAQSPAVVLAPASPRGNEVIAHVAARLDLRMAANVTEVISAQVQDASTGDAALVVRRQVMGGAVLEELDLVGSPALFTMAGHAVEHTTVESPAPAQVIATAPISLSAADLVAAVRRTVPVASSGTDLTRARVVVGGGRGVGGADQFDELIALAGRLGGALGVSRVVTSLGWRPHHEQVGQTGSRITPDVYLACGISGAIQHWAGCSSAKTIIAVNTDPEAPMVTKANYAVVGDLHQVVPAISSELDARHH